MPTITYDDFAGGLDVRASAYLSKGNILRVLQNAYVTTGKSIRKRPCLKFEYTLEAGTVGLKAFNGKLNTFYGHGTAITHADTRFVPLRVPHWTSGAAPTKIHYADQYNALLYVAAEYAGPVYRHHYLDDPGAWVALTNYSIGNFVRPTTPNGFRYEVTTDAGSAAAGEPVWPLTVGTTVVDGGITWTCRTFAITDTNCPHTKQVAKQASKIYAVGTNATTARYCKTGDPRDWTAASDAGFIAPGLYARGSDQITALNIYSNKSLAVFFSDNAQLWAVDPNPALIALTSNIEGVGTLYARAAGPVSLDLFFLAQTGYRSMQFTVLTQNLQDTDVGTAIDSLIRAGIASTDDPIAIYYPKLGQFICINGATIWVYSFSRASKISAWSKYTLPFSVDDACVLNQELYVRTGNDVYRMSDTVFKDGVSSIPLVDAQMYYQDAKKPSLLKGFYGIDLVGVGNPMVSFLVPVIQPDGTVLVVETGGVELPALTEPGNLYPVELAATRIAPHFTHQKDEQFELSSASLLYNVLGDV